MGEIKMRMGEAEKAHNRNHKKFLAGKLYHEIGYKVTHADGAVEARKAQPTSKTYGRLLTGPRKVIYYRQRFSNSYRYSWVFEENRDRIPPGAEEFDSYEDWEASYQEREEQNRKELAKLNNESTVWG